MFHHLHVHTDYSLLDGLGKVDDYVQYGKELGMESMAFTDHGTMAGLVTAYDSCKKYGMKFIGGFEAYVSPDGTNRFEKESSNRYNHLVILFKNETGYRNGCYLVTKSNTEGFYYKPRIDFDLLKEHGDGLIILSACVAGAVPQAILSGDMEKAKRLVMQYKSVWGDDYYLEIQDHGLSDEQKVIHGMLQLSKECGVKLVATNDCHYVRTEDKEAHDWLLCMQTKKKIYDKKRLHYQGDYHLKSEKEMLELFPYCTEAVYNTQEIADKCDFEFEYGHYRMPKVHIPAEYGTDYFRYLEAEAWKGYEKKYPVGHAKRKEATKRLEYELNIVKQMGFAEYFLDIRKTIQWAKNKSILVGPGRGSGAGSCMNYCLGITDLDPLQYGLLFERFLNPERVSMPDIDTDYDFLWKDDILQEEADDYGKDCFAKIRTFQSMAAKEVLKSCTRVSGIEDDVSVGNKLAGYITDKHTLSQEWDVNPDLQAYVCSDPRLKKIWNIALKLEGLKKSASTHACGHIPTPVPCEQLFPCGLDPESGYLVCEYDMGQAEHLGNLKKDLLMLRNLTIIDAARKEVKKRTGEDIPLWTQDILNDKKALELIAIGDTDGIFQLESDGMKMFMRQLQPSCFEDVIAGVALYRPGPMDYIPDYVKNKHDPEKIHYLTPELEPILKPTYGIIVYQEQVMQIVQKLAGFSMGRADLVRKAMGKKKQDIMNAEAPHFIDGDTDLGIEGCINRGISRDAAEEIWKQMVNFAKYAFNKSHAACYAAISMETAYLKAHYPHEFAVGLLTSVMDKSDKLTQYINSFRQMGISILPPDVTRSEYGFSIEDDDKIRFGLCAIKGVSADTAKKIPDKRRNASYKNLEDFITRNIELNKSAFENLAKSGALDAFGYNRHTVVENITELQKKIKEAEKKEDPDQLTLFDLGFIGTDAKVVMNITDYPDYSLLEKCRVEKESTGMYISGHPAAAIRDMVLTHGGADIANLTNADTITFGGVVTEMKRTHTKKGAPMMILTVEDTTGSIKVLLFEKTREYWPDIHEDGLVFITGTLKNDDNNKCIFLETINSLHDIRRKLWIGTKDASLINLEKQVNAFIKDNPGVGDEVIIASKMTKVRKSIGEICISDTLLAKARSFFGTKNVAVTE